MNWDTAFAIAFLVLVVIGFVAMFIKVSDLRRNLDDSDKSLQRLRDEHREFYWDMHRAVAAMGLKKMPGKGPEWVKE